MLSQSNRFSCSCIEELKKKLSKELNVETEWIHVKHDDWFQIRYRPLTIKGERYKTGRYEGVDFKFCPLCGKEMKNNGTFQ